MNEISPEQQAALDAYLARKQAEMAPAPKAVPDWLNPKALFNRAKGPALWIVIGIAIGLMGQWSNFLVEIQKLAFAFTVAMLIVGGVFVVQAVGFGGRNALAEFMDTLNQVLTWFREHKGEDPPIELIREMVKALHAMAIRNAGTLVAAAIIIMATFDYMKSWG